VRILLDPGTAATQGEPVLDPRRWTDRHRLFVGIGFVVALVAGLWQAAQHDPSSSAVDGLRAFLAAGFGAALVLLALTLRGLTLPGFLIGALFITAGMLSWAYTDTPIVVWALLLAEGVLFLVWTFPWLRNLAGLPRLGTAWLGLAYWLLGTIGAALVRHPGVAVQRLAYAGLFTLAAMAIVVATRKSGRDLAVGISAAFLCALGVLFVLGSGNALDTVHAVPPNKWGAHMEYRFWGAPGLLYHPNSIALILVIVAIRVAADRSFERWQRYAVLGVVAVALPLVNSRTGVIYLGAVAVLHALLVWRRREYPTPRARWLAALLPIVLVGVIIVASGGWAFLTAKRYGEEADVTSGRTATWAQVWREFTADDVAQKLFGDAKFARAYVIRTDTAVDPKDRPKLTTDNSVVGALRRGGILGELAFLFGLGLLLLHATRGVGRGAARRAPPEWFTLAAVGSVATIPTADWLLGGTGGTLWVYLLAGEAFLLLSSASSGAPAPEPSLATAQA
jgi:O-antigen ligase/polysaccharide polymerase Wzy-like membrane protein